MTDYQRRRVVVESPFAGDRERNAAYLKAAMKDCTDRGEAPFASHMLYTQFLNDDVPEERRAGMESGFAWGEVAEACVVYEDFGVSDGMAEGIQLAMKRGQRIERRTLPSFKWGSECEGKEPNMGFDIGQAIHHMREGAVAWRKGWHGKHFIKLCQPPLPGVPHAPLNQEYIVICAENGDVRPWLASQADLLVADWCVGAPDEARSR